MFDHFVSSEFLKASSGPERIDTFWMFGEL